MKNLRKMMLGGAMVCAATAMAVPALRSTLVVTQPDGTQVTLTRAGDEYNKFYLTTDNQVVVNFDGKGYYFAQVDGNGRLASSEVLAANPDQRTAAQADFVGQLNRADLNDALASGNVRSRIAPKASSRKSAPAMASSTKDYPQQGYGLFPDASFPLSGSPKAIIILVQYRDVKFNLSDPVSYFSDMLMGANFTQYGGTGSALKWFTDGSNGKFTPDFELFGPVTLANNRSYYGANDSNGDDKLPEEMVIEACKQLDATVNFSDFDTNNDGYVDNVFVFYAGEGEASSTVTNAVWPHQWELSSAGKTLTLDGVKIDRYACSNEWFSNRPDGIGTFVHEFSHVLGLADLYHTSATVYYTPCEYSVMDYGPYNNDGCTPPTYSLFERSACGWADATVLSATPASLELPNLLDSNQGYIIPTSKDTEFFCLENRQQSGWDTYIPGHGMLIWHIDYNATKWAQNVVNNTSTHQYVDIEEANNTPNGASLSTMANWTYPGANGIYTSFTDDTTPSMREWSGTRLNMPITNIEETAGVIYFDLCGGKIDIEAPVANEPTSSEITANSFVASWAAVDGAVDYLLTVRSWNEVGEATDTNTFGSGTSFTNASGWNTSTTQCYTTTGNYGDASPSFKMSKSGDYVMTPEYDSPIVKVSFWAKGQNQTTNPLNIYAITSPLNAETLLATVDGWNTSAGASYEFTIPNNETYQLKLAFNKPNSGNLSIDDVTVTYNTARPVALTNYDAATTGGATSVNVNNLLDGVKDYSYYVQAVNAEGKVSKLSNEVKVTLSGSSAVENIDIDNANAEVEYFNLQGVKVANPGNGLYIRRQGNKVEKVIR